MNFKQAIKYLIKHARYCPTECGISSTTLEDASVVVEEFIRYLPSNFTDDKPPSMQKSTEYTHFCNDEGKMTDFHKLSKGEFLGSYSYITELEYNLTRMKDIDRYDN
jgi:hypothetical protein